MDYYYVPVCGIINFTLQDNKYFKPNSQFYKAGLKKNIQYYHVDLGLLEVCKQMGASSYNL